MAHVSYTGITDDSSRAASVVNTIQSAFVTQSTNIDGTNIRDEGLDYRNISDGALTDQSTSYVEYDTITGAAVNTAGAWSTLVLGASTFNIAGGWSIGTGVAMVRLRFRTWFSYTYTAPPGTDLVSPVIQFRLAYGMDGGAVTAVPYSTRAFYGREAVFLATNYVPRYRDSFNYCFLIPLPDSSSHTLDFVRVQVNTPGAGWTIFPSTLTAMRFLKSV